MAALLLLSGAHRAGLRPVADAAQRLERQVVGVGKGVQVALGGVDGGVAEALLDDLEVGAAGQQP
ncbi:hypothetical protein HDA32_005846 [Spinactinospora alkalitolerans]|uniref:Uncharacterized protein n=1 Tax=Spinactinospora alkalitolerans TaxID=687207 RepID=A0A852U1J2_9ACTN|nr:hypothetical protein [Spinactinospora alkalitolerans]NYE50726.1 hypothetical protein [Spinactinospora alkalitolerans]